MMRIIPEKANFIKEVESIVENTETRAKLVRLYDHLKGYIKIENTNAEIEEVLRELFGRFTQDILIPYKFHNTLIGVVIFTIMYGMQEKTYTTKDIINVTGYSKQYLKQEMDDKNLLGTKINGKWQFTESQFNEYLIKKGFKESEQ
jgi:uncharacterized protein YeeX (DUF496 family)